MNETLLIVLVVLAVVAIVLQILLLVRKPSTDAFDELRDRLDVALLAQRDALLDRIAAESQGSRSELRDQLQATSESQFQRIDLLRTALNEESRRTEDQSRQTLDGIRREAKEDAEKFRAQMSLQQNQLQTHLTQALQNLQQDNAQKLEKIRETVDEKLHATLETRLGESFRLVSERLEKVQHGLGEMRELASGVGDLKRVLTNVKSRGMFGETQLLMLLEQVFTPEQYGINVATIPDSAERVEFAIKLPGRDSERSQIWLPIDSKFPTEDYERLLSAQELGDLDAIQVAGAALEVTIRNEAKKIRAKYVQAPYTTDFGILFLPTESLYAEVLRRPALFEQLQRDHQITVAGPTTLLALLNALQMGFKSIAIEKRSSEVWKVLGQVKSEFGTYAGLIEKAGKQLGTVQNTLEGVSRRTRAIERKMRGVETLDLHTPLVDEVADLLGMDEELRE